MRAGAGTAPAAPFRCNGGMSHGWLVWQGAYLPNTGAISRIDRWKMRGSFFPRKCLRSHISPMSALQRSALRLPPQLTPALNGSADLLIIRIKNATFQMRINL